MSHTLLSLAGDFWAMKEASKKSNRTSNKT